MNPSLEPGDTLGRYRLKHLEAEGAEAEVWQAEVETYGGPPQLVALKIYRRDAAAHLGPTQRFGNLVKHPRLIDILEVSTDRDHAFMALEWVGGGSLADQIEHTPLSPRATASTNSD